MAVTDPWPGVEVGGCCGCASSLSHLSSFPSSYNTSSTITPTNQRGILVARFEMSEYHKRRLSPCRKKSKGADDDEGCQTRVGRSWSREEAELDQEKGQEGQGRSRAEVGAGQK